MGRDIISVIIPVYNVEKYLRRCIESVLCQTYRNLEVLLINDGSQDNSINICEEFQKKDQRIKIIQKENGGVSSARNMGLRALSGNYVTFIDSDDYIKETYLETLITNMIEKNVDVVACGYYWEKKKESFFQEKNGQSRIISLENREMNFCKDKFLLPVWGKLFKVHILKDIWFDEDLQVGEDALFMAKAMNNGKTLYFNQEYLYIYAFNESSIWHSLNLQRRKDELKAWIVIYQLQKKGTVAFQTAEMQYLKMCRRTVAECWFAGEQNHTQLRFYRSEILKRLGTVLFVDEFIHQKAVLA